MEYAEHNLNTLFEQLGLDPSNNAIEAFINDHRPLPDDIPLHQADFWNDSQSAFLSEAITQDADWAAVVDQLNALLRH